ncbi:O-antigen ligase family protein [Candidatus Woesebacteria bacterium]|nr:O-antigen ligase family protein [Candidatus Woesebacteria bacterium]
MYRKFQSAIHYSYYAVLFLIPLAMFHKTSELFEFNKIIVVYIFTTLILSLWIIESVLKKKIIFKRTLLDIPIALFLFSQFLSTISSINIRTSFLGYYSRYNGGLMSLLCYALLYWGFVSNFDKDKTYKAISSLLISAFLVSIYAILQHFGIDAHIWVQDVQNRVFSTLGQPNWLAAFVITLIPIAWSKALSSKFKPAYDQERQGLAKKIFSSSWIWIFLSCVYYLVLIYTKSRSGLVGFGILTLIYWVLVVFRNFFKKADFKNVVFRSFVIGVFLLAITAYNGTPWTPSFRQLTERVNSKQQQETDSIAEEKYQGPLIEVGGSSSTEIRKIVWTGALDVWKHYPILGTGVETFAYSYYNFRPVEHNLVSEWDFLYNKAHNEYLNYAATTGTLGIGSYLVMILTMALFTLINSKIFKKFKGTNKILSYLHFSFFSGLISIYITNFFGFSVVPVNLMMFMLPAFSVGIETKESENGNTEIRDIGSSQKTTIAITAIVAFYLLISIFRYWNADVFYGQGKAHNDVGNSVKALEYLKKAVDISKKEAVFWSELSEANLNLGLRLAEAEDQRAIQFFDEAIKASSTAVNLAEKDVNIQRKRASMYIKLSTFDPNQLLIARDVLIKTIELAPTEAKLWYNLGLVYARAGDIQKAKETLEKTIEMKPDYEKARYAYALLLKELGETDKAIEQAEFILKNINPNYKEAVQFIEENK